MSESVDKVPPHILLDVRASFYRATTANQRFFEDFYADLLAKKQEYVQMFGAVDMVHQYARLYAGIHKLIEYAESPLPQTLHLVATIHNRKHINVRPTHYLDWIDSLLAVLSRSDNAFNPKLADQWITVLMPGIEFMKSMYAKS